MSDWLLTAADWSVGTALGGGVLMLIGCVLMRFTRDSAARQRVGELAVLSALVFAGLRLAPAWLQWPLTPAPAQAAALESRSTMPAELGGWVVVTPTHDSTTWAAETPAPAVSAAAAASLPEFDWPAIGAALTAIYLAIAAILVVRWIGGQWALSRLRRQARPASRLSRQLFEEMAEGQVWPEPNLGRTRRLATPVAFGRRKPAVLMPDALDRQADETRLRWIFAHELTHLRRRDPWSHWMLGLAQAVYFYVPWFWWIKRQVRLCQEYVADAAAAREGAAADEYAQFLVSLAKSPAAPLGAAGLGSSSDLYRRVEMVLQQSSRGPASGTRPVMCLAGFGLLCAAVLASGFQLRADPPKDNDEKETALWVVGEPAGDGDVFTLIVTDDDKPAKKSDEKKKEEKKKVVVMGQDGQIHIVVPIDADEQQIREKVEKAVAEARKKAEAARNQAAAAKDKARAAMKQAESERQKAIAQADKAREEAKKAEGLWIGRTESSGGGGGRLGISVESPSAAMADQLDLPKDRGLVIVSVKDDSAAAKAGMKVNDVLVEFAGKPVSNDGNAFAKRVREIKGDDSVDATVLRKGRKERIKGIKLAEAKAAGAVWQLAPDKVIEFKGDLKDAIKLAPKELQGIDLAPLKGKFEIKLDGLDGAKLGDDVKKQIELKLAPLQKNLDAKQLEQMKKEIELKLNVDRQKLKDAHGELELKLDLERKHLDDVKKKIELEITPKLKELPAKIADAKKRVEVKVAPAIKAGENVKIEDVTAHIAIAADAAKLAEDVHKHIAVIADPAKHVEAAKKHIAVLARPATEAGKTAKTPVAVTVTEDGKTKNVVARVVEAGDSAEPKKSSGEKKSEKSSNVSVSVTVNDGEFKAVQKEENLEITVTGTVDGKKVKLEEVRIYDGGFKGTYSTLDKVPEKYRAKVKKLISNQEGSPVRFEFKRD